MNIFKTIVASACIFTASQHLEGVIRIIDFQNNGPIQFHEETTDGRAFKELVSQEGMVIDQEGAVLEAVNGEYRIIFEDAHRSGFHRPHWKFHIWLESRKSFPFMDGNRILYAVMFYDGEGEVSLHINKKGKLKLKGGHDCIDILYPWKVGTVGRGNPYNRIKKCGSDFNNIFYSDYDGFVGSTSNHFVDPSNVEVVTPHETHGDI